MTDKVKKNQFTLLLENMKILKLGFELKFISHQRKIPTITYRYFNYDNENSLRKIYSYISFKKDSRVAITLL